MRQIHLDCQRGQRWNDAEICAAQLAMVHFYMHSLYDSITSRPQKMHSGSSKTGQGVTANGSVSTLQRQQWSKTALNRQERSSCSSTASCPVFSARQTDQEEDPPPFRPSSRSSPTLPGSSTSQHGSHSSHSNSKVSLKSSTSTLQGSLPSLPGSVRNLKSFSAASASLQSSNRSLHSSTTSFRSSSTSFKSSSSSLQSGSSSDNDSWGTNSWSSGATCLLRSSIKQHSEEVFRVRASSINKPEPVSDSESGFQNLESCQVKERQQESQQTAEIATPSRKDSVQSQNSSHCSTVPSTASENIEKKIEDRLKFSQFLDEVTCRVLGPERLQAFGAVRKKDPLSASAQTLLVSCSPSFPVSCQHEMFPVHGNPWFDSNGNPAPQSKEPKNPDPDGFVYQWNKYMPACKILDPTEVLKKVHEETSSVETAGRTYLETDMDSVWRKDDYLRKRERERRNVLVTPDPVQRKSETKKSQSAASNWSENSPKQPNHSTPLPRPASSNLTSSKETHAMSYMQEQKENLRKNLSHTTHKLNMLESEFDTTRQYLEKELRQTQETLDKFIDELHRIQSSYAALQRINHDLQDKIHKKTQLFEEEKRALSQEIIVLNNHLMEAKLTIEKLRKDNDLYRKDCHLAAQLLRCGKSQHRAHKVPEQPTDFQRGASPQIKKHGHLRRTGLGLTPYSDTVPTAINARILEKPEAGSSFSIAARDLLTNSGGDPGDALHRSVAYKSSDLYCSDTALYCPVMERQYWKRPRSVDLLGRDTNQDLLQAENSTESIPEVNTFQSSFSNSELPLYEFPIGSPPPPSSYSNFSVASDEKSHTPSSSLSSSQLALYMDWQAGDYEQKSTPAYDKSSPGFPMLHSLQHMSPSPQKANSPVYMRTASYGEPYQPPQFTSSHSKGSTNVPRETHMHITEDINTRPYHSPGRVSPYSFFQQRFDAGPANKKLGSLHSSFQGGDNIFHTHTYTHNTAKKVKKEYRDISPNSSEPLHQNPPEASKVQHYQPHSPDPQKKTPPHNQTFGSIGLSRKDSLSKAQLYGTLLN